MALWIELVMFGALPIAFALWQIRDVRREQQRRRERQPNEHQQRDPEGGNAEPPVSPQ